MPVTIELTDQDLEYLKGKRGNKITKFVADGITVVFRNSSREQ